MSDPPKEPTGQVSPLEAAMTHPEQLEKLPPCSAGCLGGGNVRGWISIVAQRHALGFSEREAYTRAWNLLVAANPFPATLGRICPHPCEANCSRKDKDGSVAINALERFLGDWALEHQIPLPMHVERGSNPESIGVIGAGPAGLSFAYQMARRGYSVTVYEKEEKPGGMLFYGIPSYRLPEKVIAAEVDRLLDLGIELRLNTAVGNGLSLTALRDRHEIIFLGIGAGRGLTLGIPGEDGVGTWTGTEYLSHVNRGKHVELGAKVVVIGGGNTAVDAARTARRTGAQVTILYRRTRKEMPAIDAEIDDALTEGVNIELLTAPITIRRRGGRVRAVVVQRMELGQPDGSGRRAPVPVPGSEYEVPAESVIAAVSQQPDWSGLNDLEPRKAWVEAGPAGEWQDGIWSGGDALGIGVAGLAIGQGRLAAEAAHAQLRELEQPAAPDRPSIAHNTVKSDFFAERERISPERRPAAEWIAYPDAEIQETISEQQFLEEVSRCFSCGLCFGCERCLMYCNSDGFARLKEVAPGSYFALNLDLCQACRKCIELCPCGFLSPSETVH